MPNSTAKTETQTLADVLPPSAAATIRGTFECMDIAEEEIAKANLPDNGSSIFKHLYPNGFVNKIAPLYRSHCKELIDRSKAGRDLRPGTKAECVLTLFEASLKAPIKGAAYVLYKRLFEDVINFELKGPPVALELYEGEADELFETLRKKLTKQERKTT